MSDIKAGDTVEMTIDAKVVCTYQSGRIKLRWHSGEEVVYKSDARLNNE